MANVEEKTEEVTFLLMHHVRVRYLVRGEGLTCDKRIIKIIIKHAILIHSN